MSYKYSKVLSHIKRSEIRELLKWTRKPGLISFGGGLPDSSLFPLKEISKITDEVISKKGFVALQYGPTQGEPEMINALCNHMKEFGDIAEPEQVCVVSSSQQGLDLLSLLFLDDRSPIILEMPSYLGAIQVFGRCNANMFGIPMDHDGMDMNYLVKTLDELKEKGEKPRFIYTIPDFQNPSGITMSLERRKKLIEIAHDREIPILEDSPYRELRYIGEVRPSLWSLASGKGVVMLKTFSKILFPGMRMGWIVGDKEIIDKVEMIKQSVDLCTPSFNQYILAEYINQGFMKKTVQKAKECYEPKLNAMLETMEKFMPKEAKWSKPEGGMFLWVELPDHVDTKDIFMSAIEHNVAYVIGSPFYYNGKGKNSMRLSYSFPSLEQIEVGIERLAKMLKEII